LPSVQLITPSDGHRKCPKHAEFRDKINFGYLMHLVGYLYEEYNIKVYKTVGVPWTVTVYFPPISWEGFFLGTPIDINE
jgi:hypothetical protein